MAFVCIVWFRFMPSLFCLMSRHVDFGVALFCVVVLFLLIICWFICFVLFASCLVRVVLVGGCVACCLCGLLVLFCVARPVLIGVAAGHITILINATEFVHHSRPVIIVVTI